MKTVDPVARELDRWFSRAQETYTSILRGLSGEDAGRFKLLLHGAISRKARAILSSPGGEELFSPTCLLVGSACLYLELTITAENWKAAAENVLELSAQLAGVEEFPFGLIGTPSQIFLGECRTQLRNAGLGPEPSTLSEKNRRFALALAVNFAMRLLIALGLSSDPSGDPAFQKFSQTIAPLTEVA